MNKLVRYLGLTYVYRNYTVSRGEDWDYYPLELDVMNRFIWDHAFDSPKHFIILGTRKI